MLVWLDVIALLVSVFLVSIPMSIFFEIEDFELVGPLNELKLSCLKICSFFLSCRVEIAPLRF